VTLTAEQILQWCSRHLESFMVPKLVEFRSEFPKTSTGKVSKRELALAGTECLAGVTR
jgi:acyl-CoA synthetase (AMP-forming)/AMP-acid ligase II